MQEERIIKQFQKNELSTLPTDKLKSTIAASSLLGMELEVSVLELIFWVAEGIKSKCYF